MNTVVLFFLITTTEGLDQGPPVGTRNSKCLLKSDRACAQEPKGQTVKAWTRTGVVLPQKLDRVAQALQSQLRTRTKMFGLWQKVSTCPWCFLCPLFPACSLVLCKLPFLLPINQIQSAFPGFETQNIQWIRWGTHHSCQNCPLSNCYCTVPTVRLVELTPTMATWHLLVLFDSWLLNHHRMPIGSCARN